MGHNRRSWADLRIIFGTLEPILGQYLAIIGRYVLDPAVFPVLRETQPGRGGEIQLTDALRKLISVPAVGGGGVRGVVFRGRRYDTGDKQSYLRAVVTLALQDSELGPDFRTWLLELLGDQPEGLSGSAGAVSLGDHLASLLGGLSVLEPLDVALPGALGAHLGLLGQCGKPEMAFRRP